jgi:segregation and condensation protein A
VTFLAVLELAKEMLVEIVQEEPLAAIYVRSKAGRAEELAEEPIADAPAAAAE